MLNNRFIIIFIASIFVIYACKKQSIPIPPTAVKFNQTTGNYFVVNSPTSSFKIPVGVTTVANVDRTINYTVSSPSGAAAGTQYTALSGSVKIPAGETVDSIEVKGLFAGYPSGRRDTLIFKITGGDVPVASYNSTYSLIMQKYCNVDLTQFSGVYKIQDYYNGAPDGGPYTVTITPGTATGTTGYILISGLWGYANPPVRVDLDWTNPANFSTSVPTANWFVHSTYGQATIKASGNGTFSSCDNQFTISYETTVSAGSFGKEISVITK